jgi:hypothetical protein
MHLCDGAGTDAEVIDRWSVDLRGWDADRSDTVPRDGH